MTALVDPGILKRPVIHIREREPSPAFDNLLLAGKNVLITGAGRNIGRSIATEMASQGANIFYTDIERNSCEKLQQELASYPVHSKGFVSDISKTQDIDSLYDTLSKDNVYIDTLIHNVGIHFTTIGIRNLDLNEWNKTFQGNVFGPLYLTKKISEAMKVRQTDGSIIFLSSIHQWTIRSIPSYSASKAAVGMIIKELAAELAPFGIRVNGIAPGFVLEQETGDPKYYERALLHRSSINPRYIGRAAVYLASGYFSRFTTGTVLKIDGGLSLYSAHSDRYLP
ncbi:MAG: SDR family oxidoreductase [Gammaproteobacteria bacterium]|nr:SDR family oxidoreductase [Gammaproteobacteria bacterium]